jgi:hypothetical protein
MWNDKPPQHADSDTDADTDADADTDTDTDTDTDSDTDPNTDTDSRHDAADCRNGFSRGWDSQSECRHKRNREFQRSDG